MSIPRAGTQFTMWPFPSGFAKEPLFLQQKVFPYPLIQIAIFSSMGNQLNSLLLKSLPLIELYNSERINFSLSKFK